MTYKAGRHPVDGGRSHPDIAPRPELAAADRSDPGKLPALGCGPGGTAVVIVPPADGDIVAEPPAAGAADREASVSRLARFKSARRSAAFW